MGKAVTICGPGHLTPKSKTRRKWQDEINISERPRAHVSRKEWEAGKAKAERKAAWIQAQKAKSSAATSPASEPSAGDEQKPDVEKEPKVTGQTVGAKWLEAETARGAGKTTRAKEFKHKKFFSGRPQHDRRREVA